MPLYDQLIEFAREKQRGRRCVGVHRSIINPIVVLVIGDQQLDGLEAFYTQLKSRWSSRLKALQVCYCYVNAPYTGQSPILQVKLEVPDGRGGPGSLCAFPDTLAAVNDMMTRVIDQMTQEPQVRMMQAGIHIVLSPEDPAGVLLSDLAAVAKGRLADFCVATIDCKLYLMLPKTCNTRDECGYVCGVMDQLRKAVEYEQAVLQPQTDAAPRICRISKLINAVMLLDDMNENNQPYNTHGERLGLLLDLVENGWSNNMGFIQTAGVREGSAGPEYWLAWAADQLCSERRVGTERIGKEEKFQAITQEIFAAAKEQIQGADQALRFCCLFCPGQVEHIARLSLDEGETAVFGKALHMAYASWQEKLAEPGIPQAALQIIKQIESDTELEVLIGELEDWLDELEEKPVQRSNASYCPSLRSDQGEMEAVCRFRDALWTEKYLPLVKKEERNCCIKLARSCIKCCRQRKEELRAEEKEFAGFAGEIRQVWLTLRDSYSDGGRLEVKWIGKPPSAEDLRKAGAWAFRTGDPTKVLSMVAECVELGGTGEENIPRADPLLFCRIPLADGLNTRTQPIEQGVSAGRVLKFALISQDYNEEALSRVHIIKYAQERQAAD